MIYLIGGSPRCGKTILSKRIARERKISYISTDILRAVILSSTPKPEINKKFPQVKMKTPDTKFRFEVYSPRELLKAQIKESESMWPGINAFIDSIIYRHQDCVLEGVHLLPKYISKLKKSKDVKIIYLVKTDLQKIIKGFEYNSQEPDWMYPGIKGDENRLTQAAEMVESKSTYFIKETNKYKLKTINTEVNFERKLQEARKYLLG